MSNFTETVHALLAKIHALEARVAKLEAKAASKPQPVKQGS